MPIGVGTKVGTKIVVSPAGVEPARPRATAFKAVASTCFATGTGMARNYSARMAPTADDLIEIERASPAGNPSKTKPILCVVTDDGCHECASHSPQSSGYVQIQVEGRLTLLHRYVFEQRFGPISDALQIDHQCGNKRCCNVDHLALMTFAAHRRRHGKRC